MLHGNSRRRDPVAGGRRPAFGRPIRRRPPAVEALEARSLLSLTFQFADAVAVSGNGSVDVESNAVVNDAAGNVYVTGSLQGTADFDPGPGVTNLSSTGSRDVFLARYSRTGALVWARDLRGAGAGSVGQGGAIAVDGAGNIVITGTFTGAVNFDPGAGNTTFSSAGRNDVYVARFDPGGNLLWARDVVGAAGTIDEGYALAVDGAGDVAVAGSFQGSAAFGSIGLTAGGNFDSFVAKLDPSGRFLWATATNGIGSSVSQAGGLTFDPTGAVISTGFFAGTVDFDPGPVVRNLPYAGSRDVYVQKLDPAGNLVWAVAVGSPDIDQGNSVASDAAGNVYVTGTFSDAANFNPGAGVATLTAGGFEDAFLLKLNASGQFVWANDLSATGFNAAQGTGVALDGNGHVFVAGYYQGTLTLDPKAAGATLSSAGSFDAFVAEYDTAGNFAAGQSAGGANFDADFGVGVNTSGQVAIAGRFSGPSAFGPLTLPAEPGKSIFIAQLSSASAQVGPPAPLAPILEARSDTGSSNSDGLTNARTLVFDVSGVSAPGNLIELLRDGVVVGSRAGAGAVIDPGPVPDGVHTYTARQTDAGGLVSPAGSGTVVTVDTQAPAAPPAPSLLPDDDSGVKGDGVTNVRQPRLNGTAEAGSSVQLINPGGAVIGSSTALANGSYTLAPSGPLADGVYALRVQDVDAAGNVSAPGGTLNLTIDATPPPSPSAPVLSAADDSGVKGDGVTNVNLPHLTGSAEPGVTVQLLNANGSVFGTSVATSNGSYTLISSDLLADGTYTLTARAIDAAGNVSSPSAGLTLTILATPPSAPPAPALSVQDDTGVSGDGQTVVRRPHVTGATVPGGSVDLLDPNGVVLATTTASTADGSYRLQPSSNLSAGTTALRVRVRDAAGNVSPAGPALKLTILDAAAGDFDGDGKSDLSVFRPSTAQWIALYSSGTGALVAPFGETSLKDIPVPADYDGSGHAELAVFRPSTAQWIILGASGGQVIPFGAPNLYDIPVPADYDGVGHAELAVFRPSTAQWLIAGPNGLRVAQFGASNLFDIPVPGDYDGVGHAEFAVFRPSTAQWLIAGPNGLRVAQFGTPNLFDLPTEGPIGSLLKLGTISATRTAALTISSPAPTSAPTPQPAAVAVTVAPRVATPARAPRPRDRPAQSQDSLLRVALEDLLAGR